MLKRIVLILMMSCSLSLQAQQLCRLKLSGVVYDSSLNTPLFLSQVEIESLGLSTATDKNGAFSFEHICPGTYELHVSHLSCEHRHIQVHISADTAVSVYLPHHAHTLEAATIKSTHEEPVSQKTNARHMELSKGLPVSELMAGISGVTLMKTGSSVSKPVVNGLQGNRVVILNNGIRQEGQQWGAEHAPEIDAFMAKDVELVRGADALRYGSDGIGGTLLVNPEPVFLNRSGRLRGEANIVAASNGRMGAVSTYIGSKLSDRIPLFWRVQGTLRQSGNIKAPHYYVDNTGYKEANYSATLGFDNKRIRSELFYSRFSTAIGIFTGSHVGNLTDLQRAFARDTPYIVRGFSYSINNPRQQVSHSLLKSKTQVQLNALNSITLTYALQENHRREYDIKRNPARQSPDFDYTIRTHTADITWEQKKFHGWQHAAGVNGVYQRNAYEGRFFIPGYYNRGVAAYWISKYAIANRWMLEGGLRYDVRSLKAYYYSNNILLSPQYLYASPSATARLAYKQNRYIVHTLILSRAWRAPSANELYSNGLHLSVAALEVGDSSLKPESSQLLSFNTVITSRRLNFTGEVYYKYIRNFINLVPDSAPQLTVRGAFPVFHYVQTNASIAGINLAAAYSLSESWALEQRTDILWGRDISNKWYLNQMPPVRLSLGLSYTRKQWFASLSAVSALKQYRYEQNSDYVSPPDAYLLVNANAGYTFLIREQPLKLSLTVSNMLNTAYRDYLNRFRYYTDEQGRNFSLRLTIPFR